MSFRLTAWRCGDYVGSPRWAQCNPKGSYKGKKETGDSEKGKWMEGEFGVRPLLAGGQEPRNTGMQGNGKRGEHAFP